MPIQAHKKAFTLQEKVDRATNITYSIRGSDDAEFMRDFLYELISIVLVKTGERINIDELITKK